MPDERQPLATIVIQLLAPGEIAVAAPTQDLGLCYLMIELARDAIRDANRTQTRVVGQHIVAPTGANH